MHAKYENNPELRLAHLYKFRDRVNEKILGEQNQEWRSELEFLLERTEVTIREVQEELL